MEHYVTLFDSLFIPQGLALHMSMKRHVKNFTLWVLCVDDLVHDVLTHMKLSNVRLLKLSQLETDELRAVKSMRTNGEYCWTLTPFAPRFVFEADSSIGRVTYLDADIWFRKDPGLIFNELNAAKKSVLITDHNYSPEYDQSATSGQYCVQFMVFTREQGESVRKWWEARCIEWCFSRLEDGKFGDQKYLDDWPERFPDQVHVLKDKELALAPWNASRFPYGNSIFWHFHGLRIADIKNIKYLVSLGCYSLPPTVRENVYAPYLNDLRCAMDLLRSYNFSIRVQVDQGWFRKLKIKLSGLTSLSWRINTNLHVRF